MKRNGKVMQTVRKGFVVFPRDDEDFIDFNLQAVMDISPFRKLCTLKPPPYSQDRSGQKEFDYQDAKYLERKAKHDKQFTAYYVINTIYPHTSWLEWDQVKLDDPETWILWEDEMKAAGISQGERDILIDNVRKVNALDQDSIEETLTTFLATLQARLEKERSLQEEQGNTSNSEPVSDSEFSQEESPSPV